MKTLAFAWVGDVMVMVESGRTIREEDWDSYITEITKKPGDGEIKVLVRATSSPPSAAQRAKLKTALNGRKVRAAVLSDSVITRAMLSAFSLFIHGVRGFPSAGVDGALEYLGVSRSVRQEVDREIARLQGEAGVS